MGLLSKIFSNTRKPEGFFGKMMVNGMNGGGHAAMANWALSSVQIKEDSHVLDIGCGGGANIARLLQRAPKGMVQGIDYSPVSVEDAVHLTLKVDRLIPLSNIEMPTGVRCYLGFVFAH